MKVLIIDDEKISRKVLLKQMEGIGDCTAVSDSQKGFALVMKSLREKQPYELITMDVSMPNMSGPQLLSQIRKKEKSMKIKKADRIKIIMVTSRMNISTIKECIGLGCDGYLSKPVNKYQLLGNLEQMGFADLPEVKTGEKGQIQVVPKIIKRFYGGKIKLPVLSAIETDIRALMATQNPGIDDFTAIVQKDIVISSKLVSIANSALYRGVEKVNTLGEALVRLGIKAASGLVSSLAAKDLFQSDNDRLNDMLRTLWMHSFACGCLAKAIGEKLNSKTTDSLFLMGIVHDIGKMLLVKAISDIRPDEPFGKDIQVAVHEIHTTFGAVLLKKLNFTLEFIRISEFHHWGDFSQTDDQDLMIINLADGLANSMGYTFFCEEEVRAPDDDAPFMIDHLSVYKHLELEKEEVLELAQKTRETINESVRLF